MPSFKFTELVNAPMADIVSACLGANPAGKFTANDIGKAVKMGPANNYVLAANNDEIEGVVVALEPATYNDGYSFGSVQKNKRFKAKVAAGVAVALVPGVDLVVAGAPSALGVLDGMPTVKKGTPTVHLWRVISIVSGTGIAGDTVLIERV